MNEAEARELSFVLLDHRWNGEHSTPERCGCGGVWLSGVEEWADHVVVEYQRSLTAMANRAESKTAQTHTNYNTGKACACATEPLEHDGNPY